MKYEASLRKNQINEAFSMDIALQTGKMLAYVLTSRNDGIFLKLKPLLQLFEIAKVISGKEDTQ